MGQRTGCWRGPRLSIGMMLVLVALVGIGLARWRVWQRDQPPYCHVEAIRDGTPDERVQALNQLYLLGDDARPATLNLLALVQHEDINVRIVAIQALGVLWDAGQASLDPGESPPSPTNGSGPRIDPASDPRVAQVVTQLLQVAVEDDDPSARSAALNSLLNVFPDDLSSSLRERVRDDLIERLDEEVATGVDGLILTILARFEGDEAVLDAILDYAEAYGAANTDRNLRWQATSQRRKAAIALACWLAHAPDEAGRTQLLHSAMKLDALGSYEASMIRGQEDTDATWKTILIPFRYEWDDVIGDRLDARWDHPGITAALERRERIERLLADIFRRGSVRRPVSTNTLHLLAAWIVIANRHLDPPRTEVDERSRTRILRLLGAVRPQFLGVFADRVAPFLTTTTQHQPDAKSDRILLSYLLADMHRTADNPNALGALKNLLDLLVDDEAEVRQIVLENLEHLETPIPSAIPNIERLRDSDPDDDVREKAGDLLDQWESKDETTE